MEDIIIIVYFLRMQVVYGNNMVLVYRNNLLILMVNVYISYIKLR